MQGLTPEDLLPLEEYLPRRRELFVANQRYVDLYRRVRIGPTATLIFENRQTLWFRLHEIFRIARLTEPILVARELALYNGLLPGRDQLHAVLLLDLDENNLLTELAGWRDLRGDEIRLHLGDRSLAANLYTARPEDRCFGAAQWIQFALDPASLAALADFDERVYLSIRREGYAHASACLTGDVRRSLLEDLDMSARAA